MNTHHLFVYGSLLSGFHHPAYEYISKYFTLLGPATVKGQLYDMGTYPAAISTNNETYITGELYKLNHLNEYDWAFSQLDDYEGLNAEEGNTALYTRENTIVYIGTEQISAWIYWYNGDVTGREIIASGDVADYFKQMNNH